MYQRVKYDFNQELMKIKDAGLFKEERLILSSQKPGHPCIFSGRRRIPGSA